MAAQETSTEIEQRETRSPAQLLAAQIRGEEFRSQLAMVLPAGTTPERFGRVAATALLANPDLANDPPSLLTAALKCAADGLLPDGREAAFVVRKGKCCYQSMIGGLRKIAGEHGWTLQTRVVYENDEFEHALGLDETIKHVPVRPGLERGKLHAAYAVATHRDRRRAVEVMYAEDIAKARSKAQTQNVWNEWEDRMWEKTVGRRLFAKLSLDPNDRRISSVLEASAATYEEAKGALYGPSSERRELHAGTPPADEAVSVDGEVVDETPAGQQGEAPAANAAGGDGASPPDPDEPEPTIGGKEPVAFQMPPEVAAAHGIVGGQYAGMALGQLAEQPDSEKWLQYVLARPDNPNYPAVLSFCAKFLPGLVAEPVQGELA